MSKISLDNLIKRYMGAGPGWASLFEGGKTTGARGVASTVQHAAGFQGVQDSMMAPMAVSDPFLRQVVQQVFDDLAGFTVPAESDYGNLDKGTLQQGFAHAENYTEENAKYVPVKSPEGTLATESGAFHNVNVASMRDARWAGKEIGGDNVKDLTYSRAGCAVFTMIDNRRLLDAKAGSPARPAGKLLAEIEKNDGSFGGPHGTLIYSNEIADALDMQIAGVANAETDPKTAKEAAKTNLESGGVLMVGIDHPAGSGNAKSYVNRNTDHFTSAGAMGMDAQGRDVIYLRDPNAKGAAAAKNATIPMTYNAETQRFEGPNGWKITEFRMVREKVD